MKKKRSSFDTKVSYNTSVMNKDKKILVVAGGPVTKLDAFRDTAKGMGLTNVVCASLYDLHYYSEGTSGELVIKIGNHDIADFDIVYIRVVGKRLEIASVLVDYAKSHGVRLVDEIYNDPQMMPSTISKAMEMKMLAESGIPIPATYFGSLDSIMNNAEELLGFPFVLKGTVGRKARTVWSPTTKKELEALVNDLRANEKQGANYFAQKLIPAQTRARVLVVGGEVIGGIVRPTKFRKRFIEKVNGEYPEGKKETLTNVPDSYAELAIKTAKAAKLDVCGVDILHEDETDNLYIIEANAAPAWKLVEKHNEVNVEEKILEFLIK